MPNTPIVSGQKSAFIALVQTVNPNEAVRLASILNYYSDIPTAIGRQLTAFASNYSYLKESMGCFAANDSDLQAAGIYVNKTTSPPTDAVLIVNCQYATTITANTNSPQTLILGPSTLYQVTVNGNVNLQALYIGPGSTVNIVDSTASGALINNIYLPYLNSIASRLNIAKFGSSINDIIVEPGSFFGGYYVDDPQGTCASPVTALAAALQTHNTVELTWTPPGSGIVGIFTYYKETQSETWIPADNTIGDFIYTNGVNTGFIFRKLMSDTFYDMEVITMCNNGGLSAPAVLSGPIQTNSSTVITA